MSSLGNNVKVHFAGSDGQEISYAALTAAKTNYRLYSCYKYIVNKSPSDDFRLPDNHVIIEQQEKNKHVIQDSGLFTLMFGAGKGQKQTKQSLIDWQDKLMAFVTQNRLTATCVEIDCQKVLGVQEAWFFRERMRKKLLNKQINVFHFEDGKKGLDSLIDFSDYIAFSIPELRIVKPKTFREDTKRLVSYTKSKKPDIDIHLLGCTDFRMLNENAIATSADSTSWLQGVKYGYISDGKTKAHINQINKQIFEQRQRMVYEQLLKRNVELKERTLRIATCASVCATMCKQRYEKVAGSQD